MLKVLVGLAIISGLCGIGLLFIKVAMLEDTSVASEGVNTAIPALESPVNATPSVATGSAIPSARSEPSHWQQLNTELRAERSARQRIESKLNDLVAEVEILRQQLARQAHPTPGASNRPPLVDANTLMSGGFSAADADYLAERWGERHMARLYLRDQAAREGWLDSDRYRNERRDLDRAYSLKEELSAEQYDRFLFALGRPNRIEILDLFAGSPGLAAGMQPGDLILSYDGQPIRAQNQLRDAIRAGEIDEIVDIVVQRGGQALTLTLPRGPIGVRIEPISVAPY